MDILLNNELNTRTKDIDNNVCEFMNELKNALENPKNVVSIDKNFYNEVYNELELAPKYKENLEDIIKDSMLEYSYDTEFLYVNYDEKNDKYYVDYYDGDVTRINVTKQELQEANHKIGAFYVPILDGGFLEEVDYVKDSIKKNVQSKLEDLEKINKKR